MSTEKTHNFTEDDMLKVLGEEDTAVLCMCMNNEPYAIPVSYALIDKKLVIHCGKNGKKLDFIRANEKVCLSVSRHPDKAKPHHFDEECNYQYESVLCFGTAEIIEDPEASIEYLKKFKAHFDMLRGLDSSKGVIPEKAADKVNIIIITPEQITGRKKG